MLGSFRSLKFDCDPNCRYNIDWTDGQEALKRITPGDELLLKHSEETFDYEQCVLATCTAQKAVPDTFTPTKFPLQKAYQREIGSSVADETVTPVSIEISERQIA